MPPPRPSKKQKLSRKYGPRAITPVGVLPLGKHSSHLKDHTIVQSTPAAWKIETMPNVAMQPNKANYYAKVFHDPVLRRHAWQYMFGGLLRAVFGIYSPSKYWDRDLEQKLQGELKDDYEDLKRQGIYGIYVFKTLRMIGGRGRAWKDGQPPSFYTSKPRFRLRKGAIFYARVNRLDNKIGFVDVESNFPTGISRSNAYKIMRVDWKLFAYWLKNNQIRRLSDGPIFQLRARNPRQRASSKPKRKKSD